MTAVVFANAEGINSQLGYIFLLLDDSSQCSIVHYDSKKCRLITRSVMVAKIHALVHGFEIEFLFRDLAET